MTERINEYKVTPSDLGGWRLYQKIGSNEWRFVSWYHYMWQVKRAIKHLSTPTRYFQFGTV